MRSPFAILSLSLTLQFSSFAEDVTTLSGREYKHAELVRVETNGIIIKFSSGIVKIPFLDLHPDVQKQYGYYRDVIAAPSIAQAKPETTPAPSTTDKSDKRDDPMFADLRRRDWYEDLKRQQKLKNHADFVVDWIENQNSRTIHNGSAQFTQFLKQENEAHLRNSRALSDIASLILTAKTEEEYRDLKTKEDAILSEVATQEIEDSNHVTELRLHVSELDADILELEQRYR